MGVIDPFRIELIGSLLPAKVQGPLVRTLEENTDVFAWQTTNLVGVDPKVVTYDLNVDSIARPRKQKMQTQTMEKQEAMSNKVDWLLKINFVWEVYYL